MTNLTPNPVFRLLCSCFLLSSIFGGVSAQTGSIVPRVLDYQGRLIPDAQSSLPSSGSAWFKIALANADGEVIWTNDGNVVDLSVPGLDEPAAAVALAVASDGYFTTSLDLSPQNLLAGATLASISEGLHLHVWYGGDTDVAEETATFEKLVDGQVLRSVPFALRAGHADSATTALSAETAAVAVTAGGLLEASITQAMLSSDLSEKLAKLDSLDSIASRLQAIEGSAAPYYVALPTVYIDPYYQVQAGELLSIPIEADYTSHVRVISGPEGLEFSNSIPFRLDWNPDEAEIGQHLVTLQAENVFSSSYSQTVLTFVVAPAGMAYIPAGTFLMGRGDEGTSADSPDQTPTRTVTITNSLFMDKFETTEELWHASVSSMKSNAELSSLYLGFETDGYSTTSQLPVRRKTWVEVVAWCNMLSELEGLTPAYYLDEGYSQILRDATVDALATEVFMKSSANGYRLPTEAEWEYAARGGLVQNKYPWGDQAPNEALVNGENYNISVVEKDESLYPAFGYGLYHMAGNVREWVWDWYDSTYYGLSSVVVDPVGPTLVEAEDTVAFGKSKVVRSNYFNSDSSYLTVFYRDYREPERSSLDIGFRCVRTVEAR